MRIDENTWKTAEARIPHRFEQIATELRRLADVADRAAERARKDISNQDAHSFITGATLAENDLSPHGLRINEISGDLREILHIALIQATSDNN